jgi:hypothetical protein
MRNLRALLRSLGLLTLVAAATGTASDSLAAPGSRAYPTETTCVKVDNAPAPGLTATVVDTQTAAGTTSAATLAAFPNTAGPAMLSWLAGTLGGHGSKKNVELLHLDLSNLSVMDSETLDQPSIEQIDFPALDATGSKASAPWTLRLTTVSSHRGGAQPGPVSCSSGVPMQKKMLNGFFRVEIDALDMSHAVKVEPIIVRSALLPARPAAARLATEPLGTRRLPSAVPATSSTTISSLVLGTTTTGATLPALQQWLAGDRAPKNGAIVYLNQDLKEVLCTARLTGLVITKITTESATPTTPARARAEMTVGGIALSCP